MLEHIAECCDVSNHAKDYSFCIKRIGVLPLEVSAVASAACCADQPSTFGTARRLRIAAVDWIFADSAVVDPPVLSAIGICATTEGNSSCLGSTAQASSSKHLNMANAARIVSISLPDFIRNARKFGCAQSQSESPVGMRQLSVAVEETAYGGVCVSAAGADRLRLIAFIEAQATLFAMAHDPPYG